MVQDSLWKFIITTSNKIILPLVLLDGELATESATWLGAWNILPGKGSIAASKAKARLAKGALEDKCVDGQS